MFFRRLRASIQSYFLVFFDWARLRRSAAVADVFDACCVFDPAKWPHLIFHLSPIQPTSLDAWPDQKPSRRSHSQARKAPQRIFHLMKYSRLFVLVVFRDDKKYHLFLWPIIPAGECVLNLVAIAQLA